MKVHYINALRKKKFCDYILFFINLPGLINKLALVFYLKNHSNEKVQLIQIRFS